MVCSRAAASTQSCESSGDTTARFWLRSKDRPDRMTDEVRSSRLSRDLQYLIVREKAKQREVVIYRPDAQLDRRKISNVQADTVAVAARHANILMPKVDPLCSPLDRESHVREIQRPVVDLTKLRRGPLRSATRPCLVTYRRANDDRQPEHPKASTALVDVCSVTFQILQDLCGTVGITDLTRPQMDRHR